MLMLCPIKKKMSNMSIPIKKDSISNTEIYDHIKYKIQGFNRKFNYDQLE